MSIEKEYLKKFLAEDALWEMANLVPKETGLPVEIYISGRKGKHGPRLKFMTQRGRLKPSMLAEITIEDVPRLIARPDQRINATLIKTMKEWVLDNKEVLLDLYHGKLTEHEASTIIVNKYGEKSNEED